MEHYDNIEKYARGELSPEERSAFEAALANDGQLAEGLAAFRKSELAIKAAARKRLREAAGSAYDGLTVQRNQRILLMRRIAVAAGFFLILSAGMWWMRSSGNEATPEQLYAQYFEMPASPNLRNGNLEANEKWIQAVDLYNQNNFAAATPLFREILLEDDFNQKETTKLLLGAALLSDGQADEAFKIFNEINPESTYKEDAEWYRALALLKAGNTEQAKALFQNISQQARHFKKKEAAAFLQALQ